MENKSLSLRIYGAVIFALFSASLYGMFFNFVSFDNHIQRNAIVAVVIVAVLYPPLFTRLKIVLKRPATTITGVSLIYLFMGFGVCFMACNVGIPALAARLMGQPQEYSFTVTSKSSGTSSRGCKYYIGYSGNGIVNMHHCVNPAIWGQLKVGDNIRASTLVTTDGILVGRDIRPEG